ncbi:hypothetical protein [Nitrosarchaeum koreense]|uniref:Trans-sialidase n=1 Tax=Nitrosarchaeum koreense MY1 TaxID=1001994 RepID=F9CVL2_9ARCH|nr:hypothetical protein [Nitrosarchaeum koreense]EGP93314.1 Trans-sialidase [Nitrosarchaeum koreense MY1]
MATKKQTKQDLENKIAELEAKLDKLATQLEAKPAPKPAEVKPAEVAKPAPKPAEVAKPAEVTKPKGVLPKGSEPKPADVPKPSETKASPPATVQAALENAYQNAKMTDFHWYRAHVTGYSPAPNRYFVRRTAPVGKVPSGNWNDQKAKVPGYTQPSNQYFATRPRLAYHPADKMFGGFSGVTMTVDGVVAQAQTQQAPPKPAEAAKPKGTLPKGVEQSQTSSTSESSGKSRKEQLEEYEKEYLQRMEQQRIEDEKRYQEAVAEEVKTRTNTTHGALPKGFEAKPSPEPPKTSRGTLPKGF